MPNDIIKKMLEKAPRNPRQREAYKNGFADGFRAGVEEAKRMLERVG